MRWRLETVRRGRAVHMVVTPLDDDARQEVLWPVHPKPLCARKRRPLTIRGVCEDCTLALAGLDAYTDVVARWEKRIEEKRKENGNGDNEEWAGGSCTAASVRAA